MTEKTKLQERIQKLQKELAELQDSQVDNSSARYSRVLNEMHRISDDRVLNALPDLLFIINKDGIFLDFFASDESALLVPPEGVFGTNLEDNLPEFLVDLTKEKIKQALDTKTTQVYNYAIEFAGKQEFFECRIDYFDEEKVLASINNVTDTEEIKTNAVQQRDYLFQVLESSPIGIVQLDEQGKLIFMNQEFKRKLNVDENRLKIGSTCKFCNKIICGIYEDFSDFLADIRNQENKRCLFPSVHVVVGGEEMTFMVRAMLTRNPVTNFEEIFLYLEDITEMKKNQEELEETIDRLATTQDIGRIAYWQYDRENDCLSGFSEFLKYLPKVDVGEIINSVELLKYIHPEDVDLVNSLFESKNETPVQISEQFRFLIHGEVSWVEVQSESPENLDDEYAVIVGTVQDITKQKQQEEELYENRKLLDTLLEQLPVAVYVKEAATRKYALWNKAAEELFGKSKSEVLGKTDPEIFSKDVANFQQLRDNQCLETGIAHEFIEEKFRRGDELKFLNSFQVPIALHGKYEAILGISIDITEKKLVEKELISAKNQAEKSDDLKSSFLANMSHEIRNPMNSIVGFSKILVEEENLTQKEKTEFIELINTNAKQLLRLISDIIDIAKIENNKLKIFKQNVSVNALIDRLNAMSQQSIDELGKANIEIRLKKTLPDSDCLIYTDEQRFLQVFNNLLSNAFRFTERGYIEFGYEQKNLFELEFFVKDSGKGIPQKDLQNIFAKFDQGSDVNKHNGGSGLGLSITQELVKYLGGKIWVESEEGKGTCFRFTLPRESTEMVSGSTAENKEVSKEAANDWSDYKILIVDDNPDVQSFVRILLKRTRIQTFTADNGKLAVDFVEEFNGDLDVILMDIQMPVMNGVNAMKIIKNKHPHIGIFAQTAFALEGDEHKFIEEGFDDYVSKPIHKKALIGKISKIIERKN